MSDIINFLSPGDKKNVHGRIILGEFGFKTYEKEL